MARDPCVPVAIGNALLGVPLTCAAFTAPRSTEPRSLSRVRLRAFSCVRTTACVRMCRAGLCRAHPCPRLSEACSSMTRSPATSSLALRSSMPRPPVAVPTVAQTSSVTRLYALAPVLTSASRSRHSPSVRSSEYALSCASGATCAPGRRIATDVCPDPRPTFQIRHHSIPPSFRGLFCDGRA